MSELYYINLMFFLMGRYHNQCPSVVCRNAVPSAEAAHHRWREDHHSEPYRSAEVKWIAFLCNPGGGLNKCRINILLWSHWHKNVQVWKRFSFKFFLAVQEGSWESGVWGAWSVCRGCADQHRRRQGEHQFISQCSFSAPHDHKDSNTLLLI